MAYAQTLPARVSAADHLLLDERSVEKLRSRTAQTEGPRPRVSEVIDLGTHGLTLPARDVFAGVRFAEGA